jgi:hypothetical protein
VGLLREKFKDFGLTWVYSFAHTSRGIADV